VPEDVVRAGGVDVVAPDDDRLGHLVPGIVVALGKPLSAVEDAVVAEHRLGGRDAGRVAADAGEGEHDVGAAVVVGQQADPGAHIAAGAHGEDHALRPVLLADLAHLLLDEIVGLFPGDVLPLVLAALAHAFARAAKPPRMVHVLGHGQATRAEPPPIDGMLRVTLDLDQLAVFDMGQDPTPAMAAGTGRPGGRTNDHSDSPPVRYSPISRTGYRGGAPYAKVHGYARGCGPGHYGEARALSSSGLSWEPVHAGPRMAVPGSALSGV